MAESDLIRGNVDTIILKVLYEGDRYGYDLIKQINSRGDGQWEIKQPTVYACLKRLEKQGFISSYWDSSESDGGRRKYYTLTESGKEVFLKYKNEFERATALFGGLITGGDPVFLQPDDYSDVEDETYSVSKRRPSRPKRKKQDEPVVTEQAPTDNAVETALAEQARPNEVIHTEASEQADGIQNASDDRDDGFFEDMVSLAESLAGDEPEQAQAQAVVEQTEQVEQTVEQAPPPAYEVPSAREPVDPRAIIEKYYRAERGESYSDAHGKMLFVEPERPSAQQAPVRAEARQYAPPAVAKTPDPAPTAVAPIEQTAVVEQTPPAPKQTATSNIGFPDPNESVARREYKTVLSDLVERLEIAAPDMRDEPVETEQPVTEQAAVETEADKQFVRVKTTARDLGNEVQITAHNNSAKQYAHKYYYYSNRLMMTHYAIMCAAMFIIGLTLFLTFYTGLKMRMPYDYLLYMAAGLLPIIMFIVAVVCYAGEPDKRKRININFNFSIFIRCIIMIQVAVVIYCVNLIWGMPVGFSYAYLPSLIIPLAYALFIPIGKVIFMTLLQSGNYAVE